ncbi:RNA12 protein-domain-containing protein [Gorgonomyces haynaldii]|nr:RNA12 protein-domain-containing protein [Gorgonomyces haynaldii]
MQRLFRRTLARRWYTAPPDPIELAEQQASQIVGPAEDPGWHKGTLWFENIFPFKWPIFDPRTLWIQQYARTYVQENKWEPLVPKHFPEGASFLFSNAEPNLKEGGLFMEFKYKGGTIEEAVESFQKHIRDSGMRSIFNLQKVNVFQVKGRPWVEDLISRVPSSRLHVEFYGPDLTKEALYREFRQFGRIVDITLQPSTAKEVPRYASVEFLRKRAATSARNCIHGEKFGDTRLEIGYEKSVRGMALWNWANANMRISIPILLGILAAITFAIFDPLRVFSIKNRLTGRYSLSGYTNKAQQMVSNLYQFVMSYFYEKQHVLKERDSNIDGLSEREQVEHKLSAYLKQAPESLVLMTGPKGSGKSELVKQATHDLPMKLIIKCDQLVSQMDHILLSRLADQVNFFPSFGFMSQASAFLDTIITATTGAKAGLSSTKEGEIQKILECLTLAINDLVQDQREARFRALEKRQVGDLEEIPEIHYPVIIIDDYLDKMSSRGHYIYDILTQWAGQVAESRHAHVVFVSDNPSAVRNISKVFPKKSLEMFHLSDATPSSAKEYLKRHLGQKITDKQCEQGIHALGGRFHDLDVFIQKIVSGITPQDALHDMVSRAVGEIRKLGLQEETVGENPGWTPVQFWYVLKLLSEHEEVPFDAVRVHSLFKGDAAPLLQMERAGLIGLVHMNQRPQVIKAEKPLFKTAFASLMKDQKQVHIMNIMLAKQIQQDEFKKIKEYEEEMHDLSILSASYSEWLNMPSGITSRLKFLGKQLQKSSDNYQQYAELESSSKKALEFH